MTYKGKNWIRLPMNCHCWLDSLRKYVNVDLDLIWMSYQLMNCAWIVTTIQFEEYHFQCRAFCNSNMKSADRSCRMNERTIYIVYLKICRTLKSIVVWTRRNRGGDFFLFAFQLGWKIFCFIGRSPKFLQKLLCRTTR